MRVHSQPCPSAELHHPTPTPTHSQLTDAGPSLQRSALRRAAARREHLVGYFIVFNQLVEIVWIMCEDQIASGFASRNKVHDTDVGSVLPAGLQPGDQGSKGPSALGR